jgi:hypothetical protein
MAVELKDNGAEMTAEWVQTVKWLECDSLCLEKRVKQYGRKKIKI